MPLDAFLQTDGLSAGLHRIHLRVKDEAGRWSHADTRSFRIADAPVPPQYGEIAAAEVFFDEDPGPGLGAALGFLPGGEVDLLDSLDLASLSEGLHRVGLRVRDQLGRWSLTGMRSFVLVPSPNPLPPPDIVAAEWFFDTDPGLGQATPIPIEPGVAAELLALLNTGDLESGLHRFCLRVQDAAGRWSLADTRQFLVNGPNGGGSIVEIVAAEYFLDGQDPGSGAAIPLEIEAAATVGIEEMLDLGGLPEGLHTVHMRVQDQLGRWSLLQHVEFLIELVSGPATRIIAAEAFLDEDPGPGNAQALAVVPGDEVLLAGELNSNALEPGLHTVGIRVRDDTGRWSLSSIRLFSKVPAPPPGNRLALIAAEYFFDEDPGPGHGTPVAIEPGLDATFQLFLDVDQLGFGMHRYCLRVKDELNRWSVADCRSFLKVEPFETSAEQRLAAAEFFINVDPGPGQGLSIVLPSDGAWGDTLETVEATLTGLPAGRHELGLRFRDSWGTWSAVRRRSFTVLPHLTIDAGLPPTLAWDPGAGGELTHVYRAPEATGPFELVATTPVAEFTDEAASELDVRRFYRITQEGGGRLSSYRLPDPLGSVTASPFDPVRHGASPSRGKAASRDELDFGVEATGNETPKPPNALPTPKPGKPVKEEQPPAPKLGAR